VARRLSREKASTVIARAYRKRFKAIKAVSELKALKAREALKIARHSAVAVIAKGFKHHIVRMRLVKHLKKKEIKNEQLLRVVELIEKKEREIECMTNPEEQRNRRFDETIHKDMWCRVFGNDKVKALLVSRGNGRLIPSSTATS
tara:strand:- start:1280 stop:1714 length:435 start_codon:yes stop_codon:yes gene_type:complete